MDFYELNKIQYKILYNENSLKISVNDRELKRKNKINFSDVYITLDESLKIYFSNFKDLMEQIIEKKIEIELNEYTKIEEMNVKYYEFKLIKNEMYEKKVITSRRIYILNVEYYLTKGANYEIINSVPFLSYLKTNYFNLEDIIELIEREKNLVIYEIDDIKYFNNEKKIFEKIGNKKNIVFKDKLILHFHIKKPKNIFLTNLKWMKNYYNNELKKIYKKYINYSDTNQKYDLIYLYMHLQ